MPIFDQGYQHWSGSLSGHTWRWLTISRHGVRVGMKNIFLRIVVILSWLPAVGLAFMLCVWGLLEQKSPLVTPLMGFLGGIFPQEVLADPKAYRVVVWTICYDYFLDIELYVSMIVVLLVGPGLISQDLRFNALPLYFSRPLRRADYFFGKLGVIGWFLGMVIILPSLLAYVLGLLFSLDITILWDTFPLLLACLAYGAVVVLSAGSLMLGLSALTRNSRYVALFWIGLWFVSSIVARVLTNVDNQQRQRRHAQKQHQLSRERAMRERPGMGGDFQAQQKAAQQARDEFLADEKEASRSNWRPMTSYIGNLSRLGEVLLGTDTAWKKWSEFRPAEQRTEFLLGRLGPQYPWYWSAGLLAVLLGLSACILNYRVRSLDRLKVNSLVEFDKVSKWYGNIIGINRLTLRIAAGVTGLLGPNGAGKSTLLQLATGQLFASQGTVRVLGQEAWNNPRLNRHIGLCPEQDAFYEWMTGLDFVRTCARLSGMGRSEAREAAERTIEAVGMTRNRDRAIGGYSKGMRQRTKVAQALVHDPDVLFLDEPLSGTDPVARRDLMDIIQRLAGQGKSVLVSSHVLHEIEALTQNVVLLNRGRLVAEGNVREIRDLIDKYPHHIVLVCDDYRKLAARLLAWEDVEGVRVLVKEGGVMVETRSPDDFYRRLPELSLEAGTAIREVYSDDDNLEAVFKYLVSK